MSEIPFTQEDHDLIVAHGIKINHLCTSVKDLKTDMKVGFNKIGKKLDENTIACPTNRANCRKEIDKEIDDERKLIDEKIAKKVDWKYFGSVITLLTLVFAIFKYVG